MFERGTPQGQLCYSLDCIGPSNLIVERKKQCVLHEKVLLITRLYAFSNIKFLHH